MMKINILLINLLSVNASCTSTCYKTLEYVKHIYNNVNVNYNLLLNLQKDVNKLTHVPLAPPLPPQPPHPPCSPPQAPSPLYPPMSPPSFPPLLIYNIYSITYNNLGIIMIIIFGLCCIISNLHKICNLDNICNNKTNSNNELV